MKKLLLLLFALLLISCSSKETPSNKIVGTYAFVGVTDVTSTGEELESLSDDCSKDSRIIFKNNGDFVEIDYFYSYNTFKCELNPYSYNYKMMWEEVSEEKYRIFSDGSEGTVYGMKFKDKNILWMIPQREPYEQDGVTIEYTAYVYKRI